MTTTTTGAAPGAPGAAAAPARARGGLRTALRITALELRLLTREPVALVGLIAFPAVTVLILGGVFGSVPDPEFGGIRPDEHYVVGYIGVVLAQLGLVTLPAHIASHRESGVLRRYRAAGVGAGTMVASEAAVGIILGLGGALIVLVVGGAVYGVPAPDDPLRVAGWLLAGLACFVAAGLALGTLMPSSRAANAIGNFVFIPMFLLGGGGPPRDVMTGPMQTISDALPLSHVIGGLRLSWLGATDDPHALWYPAALAAAAVLLAVVVARRRAT